MMRKQTHIVCVVTSDLVTDQRMQRICQTLHDGGYRVTLLGRELPDSLPLSNTPFEQKRLTCTHQSGPRFYWEFQKRIQSFISKIDVDIINAVDLDTIIGCAKAASKKLIPFTFDAHEYFVAVPELEGKLLKRWIWASVGTKYIPKASLAYTVNESLKGILSKKYKRDFEVISNLPYSKSIRQNPFLEKNEKRLIYQGVLNKGRCIEKYIEVMTDLPKEVSLHIYGEGDLSAKLKMLANESKESNRIFFHGKLKPNKLKEETEKAWLGLNLLDGQSQSYYYSLANKFFDYMQAGIPSINSPFPEYRRIIDKYGVAYTTKISELASLIMDILEDVEDYNKHVVDSLEASKKFAWESEGFRLLELYHKLKTPTQ